MIALAVAGTVAVAAFLVAWVLVAHFKLRLTSVEAMLIRFVVAPAVGWMGYAVLAPRQGENALAVVCLTIVAMAAMVVIAMKRRLSEHEPSEGRSPALGTNENARALGKSGTGTGSG